MVNSGEQMEEIKDLLSSNSKALVYSKLLQLQEVSAVDPSAVRTLVGSSRAILSSVVLDIFDNDEEIAAPALKCLGFMVYHPDIVASIGGDDFEVIITSLVKVITATKTKSVCNLGMWCISIQQFSPSLLDQHFQSLIRAINHGLDNPFGSLSVTFEAMQAVVKLASSLTEKMRNMSSVWIPPIYRRLISINKRDRDMSERCLLKIMHLICPPPTILSKALAADMKKTLLLAMKELLDQGMKIQSLRAWGWFIRLLGPYAMKNKHLINEMLKILEQTFSEFDSQVQIASLVAWEGLIDAIIEPGVQLLTFGVPEVGTTSDEANRNLKRIKLIMAPLVGIMSSKCDVSVHASCVSTWSYLLHKLGAHVSCQSVINLVWEPIMKAVFRVGPDNRNVWIWDFCLDLFDNLILEKNQRTISNMPNQEINQYSIENTIDGNVASGKHTLKHHVISYSSWDLCQLDLFLSMISTLINQESKTTVAPAYKKVAYEAAVRLFGSLVETVQRTLQCDSNTYDDIMQCLNSIFGFLGKMCENATSEDYYNYYCGHICLQFLKVATEIFTPSILGSPLYKVGLEIKCMKSSEYATEVRCATVPGISCMEDLDGRVLPIVHLCALYFSVVVNSSPRVPEYESQLQQMRGYVKFVLSSYDAQEILHAFLYLLYKYTVSTSMQMWMVIVSCLQERVSAINDQSVLMETNHVNCNLLLYLLLYPFASWPLCQIKLELPIVSEVWNLLYVSIDQDLSSIHCLDKSFSENLCALLNACIGQITSSPDFQFELQHEENNYNGRFALLCGTAIICVLKQLTRCISSKGRPYVDCAGQKSSIRSSTVLAARFMKLFWGNKEITEASHLSMASRFLSELVNFVGCLHQKEDVLMLVESTSSPLLEWLSKMHLLDENTIHQFQLLWTEMLKALQRSQLSHNCNSSFLELLLPLLERTLDHQNPGISEAAINFWNLTYGAAQDKLEFPKKLLPLLDKLYRNGKLMICNRSHSIEDGLARYKVTTRLRKCSKRVEIDPLSGSDYLGDVHLGSKRKLLELTEHQREVRRAQQRRTRDCSGHGPGIRTYTSADFSQDNEESQDSPP